MGSGLALVSFMFHHKQLVLTILQIGSGLACSVSTAPVRAVCTGRAEGSEEQNGNGDGLHGCAGVTVSCSVFFCFFRRLKVAAVRRFCRCDLGLTLLGGDDDDDDDDVQLLSFS